MRNPDVIYIEELWNHKSEVEIEDGVWVPARPEPMYGFRIFKNISVAWKVFIGKYDAVKWENQ